MLQSNQVNSWRSTVKLLHDLFETKMAKTVF